MVLIAKAEHLQFICDRAEETYPQECCGLLLGTHSHGTKWAKEAIATENSWDAEAAASLSEALGLEARIEGKESNFAIAPQVLLQVQKQARDRGLNIIGIYHSHPDAAAIPSPFDRAIAWPEYSYIIVSVRHQKAENLFSWVLDSNGEFQRETLLVEAPPELQAPPPDKKKSPSL